MIDVLQKPKDACLYEIRQKGQKDTCYVVVPDPKVRFYLYYEIFFVIFYAFCVYVCYIKYQSYSVSKVNYGFNCVKFIVTSK